MCRHPRRPPTIALGVIVTLGLLAAACRPAAAPPPTTVAPSTTATTTSTSSTTTVPTREGRSGGEVTVSLGPFLPASLNPFSPVADRTTRLVGELWLAHGWRVDPTTGARTPDILAALPSTANGDVTVADDGTVTIRYRVRDEATWADGEPITGDDLAFTLETLTALPEGSLPVDPLRDLEITDWTADGRTLTVTLARPSLAFERLFEIILPRHDLDGTDLLTDWDGRTWVSAGPFVFDRVDPDGTIVFTRNDAFWKTDPETGEPLPHLDRVVFRTVAPDGSLQALQDGTIDVAQSATSPDLRVPGEVGDSFTVAVLPGPVTEAARFQFGPGRLEADPDSHIDDLDLRRAIATLVDRPALAGAAGGGWQPVEGLLGRLSPEIPDAAWARHAGGSDAAATLLDTARQRLGGGDLTVVLTTTTNGQSRVQLTRALASQLTAAGIRSEVRLEDSSLFFGDTVPAGRFEAGVWGTPDAPTLLGALDAARAFDPAGDPTKGANVLRWGTADSSVRDDATARYAELLGEAAATVDHAQAVALLSEAEDILADQVVTVPLLARPSVSVWRSATLEGLVPSPTGPVTWNVASWWLSEL